MNQKITQGIFFLIIYLNKLDLFPLNFKLNKTMIQGDTGSTKKISALFLLKFLQRVETLFVHGNKSNIT